jgi:protein ImuB
MELDTPIELLEALLFSVNMMLDQLILRAKARVLALASVHIVLDLEEGAIHARTIQRALPSSDKALWLKLIQLDLEAHPPQAAILAVSLSAQPGSISKVQLGLFSPQLPEPDRLDVTLARIRAIVGEENVGQAVLGDTHEPGSFRIESFVIPSEATAVASSGNSRSAIRRLRPAEAVPVTTQGAQPKAFIFREKRYLVEHAYGPWITGGNWWQPTLWGLEQWDLIARAQDNTRLCCCLVRDRIEDCWQMAALYD